MASLADSQFWWWLGAFSAVTFVVSLIFMPWLVIRLPGDYFTAPHRQRVKEKQRHSVVALIVLVLRSLLGFLLVLAGIAMLVLPGQGILTILIGIGLMEFPGKFTLECRVAAQPTVFAALNWIRAKADRKPFSHPQP